MTKLSASATYYYENMFIDSVSPNENGIITDFHHLHEQEKRWAMGPDHFELRQEIHDSLGYDGDRWIDISLEQADEAEDMYLSARAGQAQLEYDQIVARRHTENDRYY
jgi:hypothetical protein